MTEVTLNGKPITRELVRVGDFLQRDGSLFLLCVGFSEKTDSNGGLLVQLINLKSGYRVSTSKVNNYMGNIPIDNFGTGDLAFSKVEKVNLEYKV